MRITSSLIFIFMCFFLAIGCSPFKAKEAVKINDAVIAQHRVLVNSFEQFITALETKNEKSIETALIQLQQSADEGLVEIESLESPVCYDDFLPMAEKLFKFYRDAAENEYQSIANYYSMDSISYEGYDSLQNLLKDVVEVQQHADQQFLDAQQLFANGCGFKLVRNVH